MSHWVFIQEVLAKLSNTKYRRFSFAAKVISSSCIDDPYPTEPLPRNELERAKVSRAANKSKPHGQNSPQKETDCRSPQYQNPTSILQKR